MYAKPACFTELRSIEHWTLSHSYHLSTANKLSPSEGSTHDEHEHFIPDNLVDEVNEHGYRSLEVTIVDEDGDSVSGSDDEHVLGGLGGGENPEKNGIRTLGDHHLATPSTPPSLSS
ncbi:hypothetical protein M404DRAFT_319085 [Pisolithus tinctorius Marx 270]|uniref:Uncharacterized protein n=1 Tax=Pisolithus tinctorius Marx 270 TaxID=870435 RepID=A0A0C3N2K3_PISTI|nr:hypothetical protein M404DRAFT_319085 [Pisolithus tinctorius Marx 270]